MATFFHARDQLCLAIYNIENAIQLKTKDLDDVSKMVSRARQDLNSYTAEITKLVTEMHQATQAKIDHTQSLLESAYSDQVLALNQQLFIALDVLKDTDIATDGNMNRSPHTPLVNETTRQCNEVLKQNIGPKLEATLFKPYITCKELFQRLTRFKSFGTLSVKYASCVQYKTTFEKHLGVSFPGDKSNCDITGICSLENGTILLADNNNQCLKRINPKNSPPLDVIKNNTPPLDVIKNNTPPLDVIKFTVQPWSVCVINHDNQEKAAVTLPVQRKVQLLSLTGAKQGAMLNVDFICYGIAYNNGELFVSGSRELYVYTLEGKCLRKLVDGKTNFSDIRSLTVCLNGSVVYVADYKIGLVAVESTTGEKIWKSTGINALGVCTDGKGSVFVSGHDWPNPIYNVQQYSESGTMIASISTTADSFLVHPQSLCFDKSKSELYVTQWDYVGFVKNQLLKFQLNAK